MNPQHVRALVVEDEEDFCVIAREMLAPGERMKIDVVWAATYDDALAQLRKDGFDVALIDLDLGERQGLEFIRTARAEGHSTPMILLTTDPDAALDEEALAAGAADHLVKSQIDGFYLSRSIRYTIERHRADEALRASERKFRSVAQSAHDGIVAADPQDLVISWNAGAQAMFGYREDEIMGKPVTMLLPERCHAEYRAHLAPVPSAEAVSPVFELLGLSESGFEFPIELSVSHWRAPGGECVTWIIRDITHRRAAEDMLAEERNLLRTIIEAIPDRIYVKDIDGRYVIDNEAHRQLVGVQRMEDVVGKTVHDFFPPAVAARFEADDKTVIRSGRPLLEREESRVNAAGEVTWMLTSKVPLHDVRGKLVGVLGTSREITERKRAAERLEQSASALSEALADLRKSHEELKTTQLILIQTEKMESLGRLAAGVAHEVKNPLSQIVLAADYLASSLPAADETQRMVLDDIRHAVSRADTIVRGLLDFSAPKELALHTQDINGVVRQALALMKPTLLAAHAEVEIDLGEGLPPVEVDGLKVEQVFVNLCTNAIHAMPDGGMLTVKTFAGQFTEGERDPGAKVTDRLRTGNRVVIAEFCDNGHGIPPEKVALIYDPFFTTKPTGKGTGLGLTVSRKIVELHGGRLLIENRAEGGVRAAVIFSAKAGDPPVRDDQTAPPPPHEKTHPHRR